VKAPAQKKGWQWSFDEEETTRRAAKRKREGALGQQDNESSRMMAGGRLRFGLTLDFCTSQESETGQLGTCVMLANCLRQSLLKGKRLLWPIDTINSRSFNQPGQLGTSSLVSWLLALR
jgi:hypothetical protein